MVSMSIVGRFLWSLVFLAGCALLLAGVWRSNIWLVGCGLVHSVLADWTLGYPSRRIIPPGPNEGGYHYSAVSGRYQANKGRRGKTATMHRGTL